MTRELARAEFPAVVAKDLLILQVVLRKLRFTLARPGLYRPSRLQMTKRSLITEKSHCSRKSKDAPHRVKFPQRRSNLVGCIGTTVEPRHAGKDRLAVLGTWDSLEKESTPSKGRQR